MHRIRFKTSRKNDTLCSAETNKTLLAVAQEAGVVIDAPCGGKGTCGKCLVRIESELKNGSFKACETSVDCEMTVYLDHSNLQNTILEDAGDITAANFLEDVKFVMAFDIGTTTIVGYLMGKRTGEILYTISMLNPQISFGADVITRLNYAKENGGDKLTELLRSAINSMIEEAAAHALIDIIQIQLVCVVGNTCIHHFFHGISTDSLCRAPFSATITEALVNRSVDCGIRIHPEGIVKALPNIGSFVGADTVSALLACELHETRDNFLLIDIGTNGELVMGSKGRMLACSAAAGPAFEGAKIDCGMRGAKGAIDHAVWEDGRLKVSVIGDGKPVGICGSGVVDVIACLTKEGIIDETGLITVPEVFDGKKVYIIVSGEESGIGAPIYLSQQDVREVQLAKGAIAAAIIMMSNELALEISHIETVYLAGAFGNYMDAENACRIGMILPALKDKIINIGNAAGEGARRAAIDPNEYARAIALAKKVELIELANNIAFQNCFCEQMGFEQE